MSGSVGNAVSRPGIQRGEFRARKPGRRQYLLAAAGFLAGALLYEIGFIPFVSSWHYPRTPIRTIGQWNEGVAVSHFVPDGIGTYGRRLTDNPPLPDASRIVILGDSHITATVVPDHDTVGSALERISRDNHKPVNALQYGWDGACAAAYIGAAPDIFAKVRPDWVVVLMNPVDLGSQLMTGEAWHLLPHPDGTWELRDVRPHRTAKFGEFLDKMAASRLLLASQRRVAAIEANMHAKQNGPQGMVEARKRARRPDPITPEVASAVSVNGLKQVYGDNLFILYTPFCAIDCGQTPEPEETALLNACAAAGVRCESMRKDLLEDMARTARMTRGFHNTAPGEGHLNAAGFDLAARIIYREIGPSLRSE
jgi:hypothetical protein